MYKMLSDFDVKCTNCDNVSFVKPTDVGCYYCGECRVPLFRIIYNGDDFEKVKITKEYQNLPKIYI